MGSPRGCIRAGEAGMTDNYCMEKYGEVFLPSAWSVK